MLEGHLKCVVTNLKVKELAVSSINHINTPIRPSDIYDINLQEK